MKRNFVKIFVPLILLASITLMSCQEKKHQYTQYIFGTYITITVYGDDNQSAVDTVFLRNREIQNKMSVSAGYEESELMQLNQQAKESPFTLSSESYQLLQQAQEYSAQSQGSFDPSIYPLVKLWDITSDEPKIPAPEEIEAAKSRVGYQNMVFTDNEQVYFTLDGMGIDLGAIAKGYASLQAIDILKEHNVETALLDFGGNIYLLGEKPDETAWRVGVRNPKGGPNDYVGILEGLSDIAIISSGGYERFFEQDGTIYHHIIDPATGYPAESDIASVTLVSKDATMADALGTACFIMGRERAFDLVMEQEGLEAVFITQDKKIYMTPNLEAYFLLSDNDFKVVESF